MRVVLPLKRDEEDEDESTGELLIVAEESTGDPTEPLSVKPALSRKRPPELDLEEEDRKPPARPTIMVAPRPEDDWEDTDYINERFQKALRSRGLEIVVQQGDGNCLFRAVSLQVYGDANMHAQVRQQCCDFMQADQDHFAKFIEQDFGAYIQRKRQDGVHGNNPEIQAMAELFNRPLQVYTPETLDQPINIFHADYKDVPIRLSYHDGNHYNAVIDPLLPTAGLGLGLPGLQPGLADKMQVAKAVAESDQMEDLKKAVEESQDEYQRAMKEQTYSMEQLNQTKAMALSDLDATNFEIEQAVLAESLEAFNQKAPKPSSPVARVAQLPAVGGPSVASAPSIAAAENRSADEYPPSVQELVMNGFELRKVIHAYDLVGDNFDELLAFLISTAG